MRLWRTWELCSDCEAENIGTVCAASASRIARRKRCPVCGSHRLKLHAELLLPIRDEKNPPYPEHGYDLRHNDGCPSYDDHDS